MGSCLLLWCVARRRRRAATWLGSHFGRGRPSISRRTRAQQEAWALLELLSISTNPWMLSGRGPPRAIAGDCLHDPRLSGPARYGGVGQSTRASALPHPLAQTSISSQCSSLNAH